MKRLDWRLCLVASLLAVGCGLPEEGAPGEEGGPEARRDELLIAPIKPVNNACGNKDLPPQIVSNLFAHPRALNPDGSAPQYWNPEAGRVARGGIQYVSSNGLRFELVTDRCTYIKEVKIGSRVVTPSYTDGFWYSSQASTSQPTNPAHYGYNLWVFFPYQPDGSTDQVSITVGRVLGSGTATYSFPMVRVDSVESRDVAAPMGFSRAELMNMFGKALYALFNGATNSTVLTSTDGSQRRIYGYDPNSLALSVSTTGVAFSFKFKTDINNWCDPTVRAYGTFKLNADSSGLSVAWVNPAQASLDWPTLCEAVQVVPILGLVPNLVYGIIEDRASSSVLGAVETAINDSLPGVGNASLFLAGSTTRASELLVNLKLPVPSIKLQVPYDAFDMSRGGTLFPHGENLTLLASRLGVNDTLAGVSPQTSASSGPNGLPRFGSTSWPRAQTFARSGSLVWSGVPVARLMARQGGLFGTTTYQYDPGCTVRASSELRFGGTSAVRFGVNDTAADAQRLRGLFGAAPGFELRVLFLNELGLAIADGATRCQSYGSGPVLDPGMAISP